MQLNIKNGEAYRLATELAELTGESLTEVVTKALAERLAQEKRGRTAVTEALRTERLAASRHTRELGRRYREGGATSNHDWLYDENGLPW